MCWMKERWTRVDLVHYENRYIKEIRTSTNGVCISILIKLHFGHILILIESKS